MDSRADFQRLLEDMDRALRRKQQELTELDERLEAAREQLSEKEAKEMFLNQESTTTADNEDQLRKQDVEALLQEQRSYYESKFSNMTEELIEMETSNQFLIKSNNQLQFELDSLKVSNEKLRSRAQKLTDNLEEVQSANFELNIRLAKAESQSQMQQKLLIKSHEQDHILMNAFNNKLESMKEAIAVRDKEIKRLRLDNSLTMQSLGIKIDRVIVDEQGDDGANPDTTSTIGQLTSGNDTDLTDKQIFIKNLIREKDAQIVKLNEQLVQATKELKNNSDLIKSLTKETVNPEIGPTNELPSARLESDLEVRCKMLEVELNEKDKQLHWTDKRIRHFELVLPNRIAELIDDLSIKLKSLERFDPTISQEQLATGDYEIDQKATLTLITTLCNHLNALQNELSSSQLLMNTIDQLQRVILSRDEHIKRLVRELNSLNARITHDRIDADPAEDNADESVAILKVTDSVQPFQSSLQEQKSPDPLINQNGNDKFKKGETFDIIEDERAGDSKSASALDEQASHSPALDETPKGIDSLSIRESANVKSRLERALEADGGDISLNSGAEHALSSNPINHDTESDLSREATILEQPLTNPMEDFAVQTSPQLGDSSCSNQVLFYQDRLRQSEKENQLLELAMKEILLSIKWSDTRCSTILIDCPSLERLCQLIEARYIAEDMKLASRSEESSTPTVETGSNYNCDIFQFVVMKSELDILRGQNEQLRTDLKLYRRDWHVQPNETSNKVKQIHPNNSGDCSLASDIDNNRAEYRTCEIECQTDSLILIDPEQFHEQRVQQLAKMMEEQRLKNEEKCKNCSKLVSLANHLLDCIVRIEDRVNASDESYISRLLALYQLTQRLSKELSLKDTAINQLRRDNHALTQRKVYAETRLRAIETNFEIHNKVCPLNYQVTKNSNKQLTRTWETNSRIIPSLTIRSNQDQVEVPLRDGRITIALLQSIIGCLQARLDYKDERLNRLEQLFVAG